MPDAAMTLAVAALFAKGTTAIRNIYNWRLRKPNASKPSPLSLKSSGHDEEGEDYIIIEPPENYYRQRSRPMMITEWLWPSHLQHAMESPPFLIHHV